MKPLNLSSRLHLADQSSVINWMLKQPIKNSTYLNLHQVQHGETLER